MYQEPGLNPYLERWKSRVYLLVVLAFLASFLGLTLPWDKVINNIKNYEERITVELSEVETAYQVYEDVLKEAKAHTATYGPEEFFRDRNKLVPIRDRFTGKELVKGGNHHDDCLARALSRMCSGAIEGLHEQANQNYPFFGPDAERISQEEYLKNRWKWEEAEAKNHFPEGYEPISRQQWLSFTKWLFQGYLCFLPYAFFLILFHLKRRRQSIWQEALLRPGTFILCIIGGPIGVVIYSGIDSAVYWRFAKFRHQYTKEKGTWHLSDQEEAALRLQAEEPILAFETALQRVLEMPNIVVKRSRLAIAISFILMFLSTPFLAAANVFGQSQKQSLADSTESIISQDDLEKQGSEKPEPVFQETMVVFTFGFELPKPQPVVWVEVTEILTNPWSNRAWFLPPSLAPPAKFKEEVPCFGLFVL